MSARLIDVSKEVEPPRLIAMSIGSVKGGVFKWLEGLVAQTEISEARTLRLKAYVRRLDVNTSTAYLRKF